MQSYSIKSSIYELNVDQVSKINRLLPKGYKLITTQQNTKRISLLKKKPKIQYVPLAQNPALVTDNSLSLSVSGLPGRRTKAVVSYYQGQQNLRSKASQAQDYQPERQKIKRQLQQKQAAYKNKQSLQYSFPPVFPLKLPSTPKEIIEQFQKHPKFSVIEQFRREPTPKAAIYDGILARVEGEAIGLVELVQMMGELFINIYSYYPRTSSSYNDAPELQAYFNSLISVQKGKIKQSKTQKYRQPSPLPIRQEAFIPQGLSRQQSSASVLQQQLLRKKTLPPTKPDIKNITIMDKRILGQNIKKLPNECLPEICKIVYQTLETREEYVIDIDTLPLKKVKELQIYVNNCMMRFGDIDVGNQLRNQGDSSQSAFIIEDDFD